MVVYQKKLTTLAFSAFSLWIAGCTQSNSPASSFQYPDNIKNEASITSQKYLYYGDTLEGDWDVNNESNEPLLVGGKDKEKLQEIISRPDYGVSINGNNLPTLWDNVSDLEATIKQKESSVNGLARLAADYKPFQIVTIYENCCYNNPYSGNAYTFYSIQPGSQGSTQLFADLSKVHYTNKPGFDNYISSIKIHRFAASINLYENKNFTGRFLSIGLSDNQYNPADNSHYEDKWSWCFLDWQSKPLTFNPNDIMSSAKVYSIY